MIEPSARTYQSAAPCRFIQVFNRYLMPGGEETSVARIAAHLEQAGHQVDRFWRASAEWQGPAAPAKWKQALLTWNNPSVLRELEELHRRVQPRAWILHNVVPVVSLGVYRLARQLGVPVIQWLHNYRPLSPSGTLRAGARTLEPEDRWLAAREILAGAWRSRVLTAWLALGYSRVKWRGDFAAVRAWVAVSDEMRRLFERGGFPPARLFTLRHAWDLQTPAPPDTDEGYFLFLGRMVETKGVRFLLDLWRQPALKDLPLVLAGEGPLYDELAGKTPAKVRWAGFVRGEAKRRLIAGCRAVLFPCLWPEPLSTVAYEAYEQGKPMLSSALGGMKELVLNGQTGRLLEPAQAAPWTQALLEFSRDAKLSRRLGRNGRRWLEENVSPAAWNRQFDQVLRTVLGQ